MRPVFAINVRRPFESELTWFRSNSSISGYAAEDDQVVLNPYSSLTEVQRACVTRNEAIRILMRRLGVQPNFDVDPHQRTLFRGTFYENDQPSLCATLIARIASGDPSAGEPSERQIGYAAAISAIFDCLVVLTCDEDTNRSVIRLASELGREPGTSATA
jgi:hypothetical protein